MEPRRIYISHVFEDSGRVQPLRVALEALGMTILNGSPDAMSSASTFLACFSTSTDGRVSYRADELQSAVEHAQSKPADWLMLVQLTPCNLQQIPGIPRDAVVLDLEGHWYESLARLIAPPAVQPSTAGTSFSVDQQRFGGNVRLTNVDTRNGATGGGANARSEITGKSIVVDGDFDFTNYINRGD